LVLACLLATAVARAAEPRVGNFVIVTSRSAARNGT
jgi:hypothetical protein